MSGYRNHVELEGNAGRDAETKYTTGGKAVTKFSLAVGGGKKKDGNGEWPTHWFNVTAWDNEQAQSVKKGNRVGIMGRLSTSTWSDKETGQKRTAVEIVAQEIEIAIDNRQDREPPKRINQPKPAAMLEPEPDDIPF